MIRSCGILMHMTSLPSPYGCGSMGKEAFRFIDFLASGGQKWWQMLPINPTGYGDSPYQPFSAFAGNPYFIDLDQLVLQGLLTQQECQQASCEGGLWECDYGALYQKRLPLLFLAYKRRSADWQSKRQVFLQQNTWAEDYALFTALKNKYDLKPWYLWPDDIKLRKPSAIQAAKQELAIQVDFAIFCQYLFFQQWQQLLEYAHQKGVCLIGDLPIYVAMDSADVWSQPFLFDLDKNLTPKTVAGCPPDYFSPTGQLWGNPIYNWSQMKNTEYAWWTQRMRHMINLFDLIRIDHFRGFASYYSIPYGEKTAEHGSWVIGPGKDLFETMTSKLGPLPIIAEDLGTMGEDVLQLMDSCGYPGMKVLQFAFDSGADNAYLPQNYVKNCVVYTGTHDNDTFVGWWHTASDYAKQHFCRYNGFRNILNANAACGQAIRLAMASVADLCIVPMQDYLKLDTSARMNMPSTAQGNWKWRITKTQLNSRLAEHLQGLAGLYNRKM